jgi:hypothetical protein
MHTPGVVSMDHWKITVHKVEKYLKTDAWRKVIADIEAR